MTAMDSDAGSSAFDRSSAATSLRASGTPGFAEETRAFLQSRLRLLTGALALLFGGLSMAFVVSSSFGRGRSLIATLIDFSIRFPNSILFLLSVTTASLFFLLRWKRLSERVLTVLDGVFLQLLLLPCLLLYSQLHFFSFSGFSYVVTFLVLFILTRAILIPSTVGRTLLFSLPAPLAVLAIQVVWGGSYAFPGQAYPAAHWIDTIIQNQVVLWGAIAVGAVASRVNLILRRRGYDARRIGQYEIERPIGSGAMGEVYSATHALLKRPTAVKFLRPDIAGEETLRRFEREVRQTARLSHPNTVSIFDYGHTADGIFYYAMEFLDGATLRQIVERCGAMSPGRVIHVLERCCAALNEAHGKGIVHRDIKAANIMLCLQGGEYDVPKILDFGLAKVLDEGRAAGRAVGTPETIAPELLQGKAVRPASDLYSLSVTGYWLLTGRLPFEARSVKEILQAHLNQQPVRPSELTASVPVDLEAILLSGLAKDPLERPVDAATYREALIRCRDAATWTASEAEHWWRDVWTTLPPPESDGDEISRSSMLTRLEMPS